MNKKLRPFDEGYNGFWIRSYGILSVIMIGSWIAEVISHLVHGTFDQFWLLGITIFFGINFLITWGMLKLILRFKILEKIQYQLERLRKE